MYLDDIALRPLETIGADLHPLIAEAESEGHGFMRRLWDDWAAGANRFDGAGECLIGAYAGLQLVGVGGLNKDPYTKADAIGRLRHVYVCSAARRFGVGTLLVEYIRDRAALCFSVLRLRTATAEAAEFYQRLGFIRTNEEAATHRMDMGGRPI